MTFKIVDTIRGKVLQEFPSKDLAEKALERFSVDAPVALEKVAAPRKRTKKAVTTDGK